MLLGFFCSILFCTWGISGQKTSKDSSSKYYPYDDSPEVHEKGYLSIGTSYSFSLKPFPNLTSYASVYKWTITADDDCMPELSCPVFSLASGNWNGRCDDQWLEVTDGNSGLRRYCGKKGPMHIVAAKMDGLRDLYLTFKSNSKFIQARFDCIVVCGKKLSDNYLPNVITPKINPRCTCGQKPKRTRIIGGHNTYFSEFPWVAAMVVAQTRQPFCIGSVINDRMILTAGHCFKGKFRKAINTQIILNGYEMDAMPNINVIKTTVVYQTYDEETLKKLDSGNGSFRHNIDQIWIHPHYISDTSDFDTALMILSTPINMTAFKEYSPICLPELTYDVDAFTGWKATIAGWGLPGVTALGTNTLMKQITVDVYKPSRCKQMFGDRLVSVKRQLCAAYFDSSEDSCAGDSGGAVFIPYRTQVWYQIGIISWGDGCALVGHPGIYYRTTSTNQWIRHMSNSKEAVWCDVPD